MLGKKSENVKSSTSRALDKQALGRAGEDLAVQFLVKQGFKIVERNFRTRFGEIDIVATKNREYFFVEVKTRESDAFGTAIESLPFYRVERLKKMALLYATQKELGEKPFHLSLLGIDDFEIEPKITFIQDITGEL